MVASFAHGEIVFQYPENWQITEESLVDWPRTVTVESPGGSFLSIFLYPRGAEPNRLLAESLAQMRSEYEDLESSVVQEEFDESLALGYELYFYCLDFLIRARVMTLPGRDDQVFLVFWQAEDREYAASELVFRAITTSLLRSQERSA